MDISRAIIVLFPMVAIRENTTVPFGNRRAEEFLSPNSLNVLLCIANFWSV